MSQPLAITPHRWSLAMRLLPRSLFRTSLAVAALLGSLTAASAETREAPAAVPLTYGYISSTAYYWDVFAAISLGFAKEEGLDIKPVRIDSASQAIQTLLTGAVDIVSVPAELVIAAGEKGGDVKAIGTETRRTSFSLVAQGDIRSYKDLKGKAIAVTQLNEAAATMVRLLLKKNGLEADDYQLVALGATPNRFAALQNGAVAAALLSQPIDFKAVAEGKVKLGDTADAFTGPYIVFAATGAWLKAQPDTAARFLRAARRGAQWLYDPNNKERAVDILVKAIKSTPEDAAKTYDFYFGPDRVISPDLALTAADLAPYLDIRRSTDDPARYVDLKSLEAAGKP
ncbi:ABC transporter substrate-binding protein [Xanthobacter sediminis]|uniref:ABC transporter substrate-binding protein n=1 Tax=Xanthobacter sediminis TaxID=3119926 RepID=UPI0037269B36